MTTAFSRDRKGVGFLAIEGRPAPLEAVRKSSMHACGGPLPYGRGSEGSPFQGIPRQARSLTVATLKAVNS